MGNVPTKMKMLTIHIRSLLFQNEHASRGIGTYTRLLITYLEKLSDIKIIPPTERKIIPVDIVHYPSFDFFFDTLPFSLKTKTVVTIHDVIPLLYPDKYPRGIKGALRLKKQMIALKTTKAIITDSETSKKDIVKYLHVKESMVHVIPLAANPDLIAQSEKTIMSVKKKHSLPNTYVLYVGDISYNKNIPQLIKTLKYLPEDIHLVCVGKNFAPQDIPEWQWIETQIAMSDVSKRIHFLTSIGQNDMIELSALYSGALCYLQPSLYEGFGLPLLEAMQCKTPVVSSNTPALLEISSEVTLISPPTGEDFANKVLEIYNWSKKKRTDFIKKAYDWSQTFSWQTTAKKTAEIYRSIDL